MTECQQLKQQDCSAVDQQKNTLGDLILSSLSEELNFDDLCRLLLAFLIKTINVIKILIGILTTNQSALS